MQCHVDGELVDADDAGLPIDDRGVTFGDAVVDTVRTYGATPFAWDRHVTRLFDACDALDFDPGVDAEALRNRMEQTLAANGLAEALVTLAITRGRHREGTGAATSLAARYRPSAAGEPTVIVTATPATDTGGPVTLQTVRTRAIAPDAVPASPLTHNRLDAVRASAELQRAASADDEPADEALLLDADGHVVSGTASDLVFVDADAVRTPALGDRVARTATRSVVRDLARAEGLPVVAGDYTPADVRDAAEAFVVEPAVGVRPVAELDGVAIGGGPVTDLLSRLFADRVEAVAGDRD
jgi:branched-chain amino acid aminotransferase